MAKYIPVGLILYFLIMTMRSGYTYMQYRLAIQDNSTTIIEQQAQLAMVTAEEASLETPEFIDTLIRTKLHYITDQDRVYQIHD